jgi:cytoskeletal protein CcmA (bactofilin family)
MIRKLIVTILALGAALGLALSAAPAVVAAHETSTERVLGSIRVEPGEHAGDVSTVNGGVHIGSDAVVGHAHAVNGGVHMDSHATAAELSTVNGGINVGDGAHITGDIHTVNGSLHIDRGAEVLGEAGNVNGGIHINAAHIGGSVITTNGDIDLGPDARIDGDVVVKEDNSWHYGRDRYPHVVIGPGTVVKGELRFERKVVLYVSDRATIGAVHGAEALKFSGDHPPVDREQW